jgi:hypothetical protein
MTYRALHHKGTPTLTVTDARGLTVREVAYCRQYVEQLAETRITRQVFDPAERLVAHWDPRLWGNAPAPNLATIFSLTGLTLLSDSVDAGWQLSLPNDAQSTLCRWDSRGTWHQTEFDPLQRPVALGEKWVNEPLRVIERFTYGIASHESAAHNQCGQLVRHDDGAGSQQSAVSISTSFPFMAKYWLKPGSFSAALIRRTGRSTFNCARRCWKLARLLFPPGVTPPPAIRKARPMPKTTTGNLLTR